MEVIIQTTLTFYIRISILTLFSNLFLSMYDPWIQNFILWGLIYSTSFGWSCLRPPRTSALLSLHQFTLHLLPWNCPTLLKYMCRRNPIKLQTSRGSLECTLASFIPSYISLQRSWLTIHQVTSLCLGRHPSNLFSYWICPRVCPSLAVAASSIV